MELILCVIVTSTINILIRVHDGLENIYDNIYVAILFLQTKFGVVRVMIKQMKLSLY